MAPVSRVAPLLTLDVACTPGQLSGGQERDALDLFSSHLNQKGSLLGVCQKLAQVCKSDKDGMLACLAHDLFCGPTEKETCIKLGKTCGAFGVGCDIHKAYCGGPLPSDGGPGCIPDNPQTPLVNEDTCPAGQTCIKGVCKLS